MTPRPSDSHGRLSWLVAVAILATFGGACRRAPQGPNGAYLDPRVSAEDWNRLFESEQRQIFVERHRIMQLAAVEPGARVADVGAGTGVFTTLLSDAVGRDGIVYAEEVMLKFSAFIAAKAAHEGRTNVVSVVGTETGIGLPPGSIDLAFLCDVYHHFDRPAEMLASIRRALKPGGEMFLVDFRRDPASSPAWLLEHVRAGEEEVTREVEAAGFARISRDDSLRDSYVVRFRRGGDVTDVSRSR
ncbi:MAG TPA: methyltransferase domain-containing protein [Polyangia bacterium]|nr:methyltransferase domain-containing protein [Polyangia bacterium]